MHQLNYFPNIDSPQLSKTGLLQIVDLFTHPNKKKRWSFQQDIYQMYYLINNKQNIQVIKDNMDKLNKFINTYFLLCFMENVILNPQCGHSISDRKVINVIFTAQRIVYIDEFIENALWRQTNLQTFIQQLRKYQQTMKTELIKNKITNQDLQYLNSLKSLMSNTPHHDLKNKIYPTNKQFYNLINQCLQQKTDLRQKQTSKLFHHMLDCLYQSIGMIKSNNTSFNLQIQKIRLFILYIRCSTMLKQDKISHESKLSKLKYVMQDKGFQVLAHYFDDLTGNQIKIDKEYCKKLFTNQTISERNTSSEESMDKKSQVNSKKDVQISIKMKQRGRQIQDKQ